MPDPDVPELSVVVAIVSDTTGKASSAHLGPCLASLKRQIAAPPTEIIVPYHPSVDGIEQLRRQYPDVRFLVMNDLRTWTGLPGNREHHDELRARGLAAARGAIVALIEDHGNPLPDWSANIVEAHRASFASVGGAIENGVDRSINWAVYFCDFLKYQNPLRDGESWIVSDANAAYKRVALEPIREVWQTLYHETSVNTALRSRGEKLALSPRIVLHQNRLGLEFGPALKERFVWGRSYGATRAETVGAGKRLLWAAFAPVLPPLILTRMVLTVLQKRRTIVPFLKSLPLTALLVTSWSAGEFTGYLTGRARAGIRTVAASESA